MYSGRWTIAAVSILLGSCASPPQWSTTIQWTALQGSCSTEQVPAPWRVPSKAQRIWPFTFVVATLDHFDLRESEADGQLYVRLNFENHTRVTDPFESDNAFAFVPGSRQRMTAVSDAAWNMARSLPFTNSGLAPQRETDSTLIYRGKTFSKRSSRWLGANGTWASQKGSWSALFSFSSSAPDDPNLRNVKEPSRGTIYLDVYNLNSGMPAVNAQLEFAGIQPSFLVEGAGWFDDRYFVFPLQGDKTRFLLCSMPK